MSTSEEFDLVLLSPILIELCRWFDDFGGLDETTDVDLYSKIISAGHMRYSIHDFSAREAPEFDEIAPRVVRRLNAGWFADQRLSSPQMRFCEEGVVGSITVHNGAIGSFFEGKPMSALWTASPLPNGKSAWAEMEDIEFSHKKRAVFSVHFAVEGTSAYRIDSLADYRELIMRYPRYFGAGRVGADWQKVAYDFHAVHLTARGLVAAQNVDIVTPHGVAMLDGWDSECTLWLRSPPDCRSGLSTTGI